MIVVSSGEEDNMDTGEEEEPGGPQDINNQKHQEGYQDNQKKPTMENHKNLKLHTKPSKMISWVCLTQVLFALLNFSATLHLVGLI